MDVRYLSLVVLRLCVLLSQYTQAYQVNTDGCSVNKTCIIFPSTCPEGDSQCLKNRKIITWKKADATSDASAPLIEIEMKGSPQMGYIALGFGRVNDMQDADVYYCTKDNGFSTAAIIKPLQHPQAEPLENDLNLERISLTENGINCRFRRPMAVSKPSTTGVYNYDLSKESFHMLVAEGPTNSMDELAYHNWRKMTKEKINFTANFPVNISQTTTVTPSVALTTEAYTSKEIKVPQQTRNETLTTSSTSTAPPPTTTSGASNALTIQCSIWMVCAIITATLPVW